MIFVDEADAFLRRRANDELISENLRNSINAFLYRSGSPSTKFMIVLATNTPQLLDEAVQDRMDEILAFDSPSKEERTKIIKYHLNLYINRLENQDLIEKIKFITKHPSFLFYKNKPVDLSELTDEYYNDISIRTEGFSGRELAKLVVSWHDELYAKDSLKLDRNIIENVLNRHIEKIFTIKKWNDKQNEFFRIIHNTKINNRLNNDNFNDENLKSSKRL